MVVAGGVTYQVPPNGWNLNGLYFDAWLRLNHNSTLTSTLHPVQTGAAITDHSYINPQRFSFDIGMSDAMSSILPGQFPSSPTRSVKAYNILKALQNTRELLTLTTKYGEYKNILIESLDVPDDYTTNSSAIMSVSLIEIMLVDAKTFKTSNAPQITNITNRGQVSPQGTDRTILNNIFGVIIP